MINTTQKVYGKIAENTCLLTTAKRVKLSNGKIALLKNMHSGAPMVEYNGRVFLLGWDEILDLANTAGLFNENTSKEADNGEI